MPARAHPPPRRGFLAELRDAVTLRAFGLVAGVLLLQLGFILSYAGAFHDPQPHDIALGVVPPAGAPVSVAAQTASKLNAIDGQPLRASVVPDEQAALRKIKDRDLDGALVLGRSSTDRLLVASAEGGSLSSALADVLTAADSAQHRRLVLQDIVPAAKGDARGLTAFYLAVGWVVGGYLVASILAISTGARPSNLRRALIRLSSLLAYSVVSGLGGALIVGPWLGALTGSYWTLAGFGALIVFAVGAFTMGLQSLTGIIGIGLAVLLFVVFGNPSAGGAYPAPLLPTFWRVIGPLIPTGAGTSGVRGIIYFEDAGLTEPLIVTAVYAVVGVLVLLVASAPIRRSGNHNVRVVGRARS